MNVTYRPDGTHTESTLVCERHPDLEFPHGGCAGPGCPPSHRTKVLADALTLIRVGAQFGDTHMARWLDRRGISERSAV